MQHIITNNTIIAVIKGRDLQLEHVCGRPVRWLRLGLTLRVQVAGEAAFVAHLAPEREALARLKGRSHTATAPVSVRCLVCDGDGEGEGQGEGEGEGEGWLSG